MKSFLVLSFIFDLLFLIFDLPKVLAQSPVPTSAAEGRVNEIQQIREAVQQKVKEKIEDIVKPTTIRQALIGSISAITTNNQITISFQDKNTIANIDPEAVYIDSKKNKSPLANLKTGQEVLVLGNYQTETDLFTAKRIVAIKISTDIPPAPTTAIGLITDISKTSSTLSFIPSKNKNQQFQIFYDSKTKFTTTADNPAKIEDIKVGQKVIAVISPRNNRPNNFTALRLILTTAPAVLQ